MFAPAAFVKQGNSFFRPLLLKHVLLSTRIKILLVVAVLSSPFARRSYKRRFGRGPMTLVKKITNSLASLFHAD